MDSLKPFAGVLLAATVEAGFWEGFAKVLADANIPHTPSDLGASVAVALGIVASQVWQWYSSKQRVHVLVGQALAAHLATYKEDCPPADGAPAPAAPVTPSLNAV